MSAITITGKYYKHFVKEAEFPYTEEERTCIKSTLTKMMDIPTNGSHPGMLLGKIQSGKTKTFLAIMGLAFDNGYQVSIVLTKGTRALAMQTQQRIQKEFKPFVDDDDVLVFDIMNMPSKLTGYELKSNLVIVVKKQKDNLAKMLKLYSDKTYGLYDKKTLIVDDEADYASVGYKKSGDEIDANLTAIELDKLRKVANDASFLQVTATPYALYLQPENVKIHSNEFKPVRPAFTELVPVNKAYIGSDYYFDDCDNPDSLASKLYIPLGLAELATLKKSDRRRLKLEDALTSPAINGLRSAFINFIAGGAIRQLQLLEKGKGIRKLSFLVHTEVSKAAHAWQQEIVEELLEQLSAEAKNVSKLFKKLVKESYEELSSSVEQAGFSVPDLGDVLERIKECLVDGEVLIASVNSDKQVEALLDDSGQLKLRTPLNVFIGGQILDRGITIGNLIGFYYGRRPQRFQQDTVLQHSRMYGYRPKEDLAVTRFYTEPTIYNAMRRMHESDVALREEIAKNPDQGIIFIKGDKSGAVVPCSPNKILLSETTTLKSHKRIIPVGFQTDYKSYTKPITEKIDGLLKAIRPQGANKEPFRIATKLAHEILIEAEKAIKMSAEEGYSFNWKSMHSAIDYMAGLSADPAEIWCLWLSDRNNNRLAGVGSHTKYVATPDTASTEGKVAKQTAKDSPMLMLFRQNGRKEQGWMDAPFYWPLLYTSGTVPTTIYANETIDS